MDHFPESNGDPEKMKKEKVLISIVGFSVITLYTDLVQLSLSLCQTNLPNKNQRIGILISIIAGKNENILCKNANLFELTPGTQCFAKSAPFPLSTSTDLLKLKKRTKHIY